MVYKRYDGGAKELVLLELKEEDTSYGDRNDVGKCGVEILVNQELSESAVKIRRRSDKTMTMYLIFREEMMHPKVKSQIYRRTNFLINWFMNGI